MYIDFIDKSYPQYDLNHIYISQIHDNLNRKKCNTERGHWSDNDPAAEQGYGTLITRAIPSTESTEADTEYLHNQKRM